MSDRTPTQCAQCGQIDDHPKVHIGSLGTGEVLTKHHDCLSVAEERAVTGSGQEKGAPKASAIIEAAKNGTHGDKLLALIESGDLAKATGKGGRNDG